MPSHEFEKMLQELCEKEKAVTREEAVEENRSRYILVADEDADYRDMVKSGFQAGFQILEAAAGQSAVACLSEQNQSIAVVILSMTLPEQGASIGLLKVCSRRICLWLYVSSIWMI